MKRKWTVLTGTMAVCIAMAAAVSMADDETKSPLHELMEKVQSHNTKIIKGVKSSTAFATQQQDVVDSAKELVKHPGERSSRIVPASAAVTRCVLADPRADACSSSCE